MQDVSKGEGRTVLFVSHNMASVRSLCRSGVILQNGMVKFIGTADEAVDRYIQTNFSDNVKHAIITDAHRDGGGREVEFLEAEMLNDVDEVCTNEDIIVRLRLKRNVGKIKQCTIGMHIIDQQDETVGTAVSSLLTLPDGDVFDMEMKIRNHNLVAGKYRLYFNAGIKDVSAGVRDYDVVKNVLVFTVVYVDKETKKPYAIWNSGWGKHNLIDVDFKFL